MKYLIVNELHIKPEPIIIFESNSDKSTVEFTKKIANENEDNDFAIETFQDAKDYIEKYCYNLIFIDEAIFWNLLGDVAVDENDDIDEDFLIFDKGTDKFYIWDWFEENFDTQIGGKYIK